MVFLEQASVVSNICIMHNFTIPPMRGSTPSHLTTHSSGLSCRSIYMQHLSGLFGNAPKVHLARGAALEGYLDHEKYPPRR
jgi:hypothetical protein